MNTTYIGLSNTGIGIYIDERKAINFFSFSYRYSWNVSNYTRKICFYKKHNNTFIINKYKSSSEIVNKRLNVLGAKLTPYYGKVNIR